MQRRGLCINFPNMTILLNGDHVSRIPSFKSKNVFTDVLLIWYRPVGAVMTGARAGYERRPARPRMYAPMEKMPECRS
jgi:hypothetical protein